jgi:hypothetical protein
MNGKIQNLKNAYASGNHDKIFRAACALVNYDKKARKSWSRLRVRSKQPV